MVKSYQDALRRLWDGLCDVYVLETAVNIPAIFAELATATGFYYSKAKAENRIKLRKKYGPDIYNDSKED